MIGRLFISLFLYLPLLFGQSQIGEDKDGIYFRKDRTEYDGSYLENQQAVIALKRILDEAGIDRIDSVKVTAYASPEGVREHNLQLSRERARALAPLVNQYMPEYAPLISVIDGGEAWEPLHKRIEEDSNLPDYTRQQILAILDDDSVGTDTKKWRLQHRLGTDPILGDLYDYILDEHYRYLRCLSIQIDYNDKADIKTPDTLNDSSVSPPPTVENSLADASEADDDISHPQPDELSDTAWTGNVHATRPILAVSTNLLYDITYIPKYGVTSIPSFSLEYYPGNYGRFSFGADVEWPMWQHFDTHRYMQIQNVTLNARWYFAPKYQHDYRGAYLLANVNSVRYGIGWEEHGWEGEGVGTSLGIGYKHSLFGSKRLFWEAGAAVGCFWSHYDPYYWGNDATGWYYYDYDGPLEEFKERNHPLFWLNPTRVWFSVGVDLFNRKEK
ncbi:MAG: DUF3575 domain-containing protein [Bacteroidales bacterium]|nr:DUF3575 domain-containing protein [Bacteroidales bacterium]